MLKVTQKNLNASMFQLPEQDMMMSLGENILPDDGRTGMVSSTLLGNHFSGGIGVPLKGGEVCIGIVIDKPSLKVDEQSIDKLVDNGIPLNAAYNMVAIDAYNKLAQGIAKNLFQKEADPTFKVQFTPPQDGGQPSVQKVELIMKGEPTGHPFWSFDRY